MDNANLLKAPGYELVNLNVHYNTDLKSDYFKSLSMYAEVRNVFDRTYVASANNIGELGDGRRHPEWRKRAGEHDRLDLRRLAARVRGGNKAGVQMIGQHLQEEYGHAANELARDARVLALPNHGASANEPSPACLGSGVRGGRAALRVEGDAGLRVGRNAVARLDGGRPDIGGEFEGSRAQLFDAGSGEPGKAQPRLGPGCASPARRRENRRHRAGVFDLPRTRRSTARCSPHGRSTAARALPSCSRSRRITRASALRRSASMRTDRCSRPGSTSATACPRSRRAGNTKAQGCSSRRRRTAARPMPRRGWRADNTCECCRLGLAFAGPGRPVVVFRNIFEGGVRDHAVMTFTDPATPGEVRRVSNDDWQISACPHHGPSLSISPAGTYHVSLVHQRQGPQGAVLCPLGRRGPHVFRSASARPLRPQSHAAVRSDRPARRHHGLEGVRRREDLGQRDDLA